VAGGPRRVARVRGEKPVRDRHLQGEERMVIADLGFS
jgi:hypothetical protein